MKVAVFHNVIAPYRIPLFERLSRQVNLTIFFGKIIGEGRKWDLQNLQFNYHIKIDFCKLVGNRYNLFIGADPNLLGTWIFFMVSKLLSKPFILWTEERDYSKHRQFSVPFKIIKAIATIISKNADICVALSKDAKRKLLRVGVKDGKIIVGPNAYPIKKLREAYQNKPTIKSDYVVFLSLSYLVERKGIQHLIKAFIELQKETKDILLLIAGTGPYLKQLEATTNNHKNIYFLGYVSEKEKVELYKTADIFILPSTMDPWGLTVNEAMICEKPIITTHDVGARELIHDNGYVVPSGNVEALYKAMKTILTQNLREMGLKSWGYVQEYSIENEAKAFLSAMRCVT